VRDLCRIWLGRSETFVDLQVDNGRAICADPRQLQTILRGAVLAAWRRTLALRLSIVSTVAMIAVFVASAGPCAAQDPRALGREGTNAIDQQRFGDALDAFTKAVAIRPHDASFSFGAGVAAFMLGRNDAAQRHFERALALNPANVPAAEWLGDLHYRAGRLHAAITIYEAARERSPDVAALQIRLAECRKELELQSRFLDLRTAHFTVLFERRADEPFARAVVDRLEAAYSRIGAALGVYSSQPITVVLYTREQFDEITKLAAWSSAAYDGRIRMPIDKAPIDRDELDRVLSHEFVHAIVRELAGRAVPTWVNEGLATALEPAGDQDSAHARHEAPRPVLTALHGPFVQFSKQDAVIAYASAAHAMRRLIADRGVSAVVALLKDLGNGAPFASAFHQRIAMRYEEFAARVARGANGTNH
jgi:tetratricopeptide (TPR) repeat protein